MLRDWPAVTEISVSMAGGLVPFRSWFSEVCVMLMTLQAVESAFVPVMKCVISGVEVDLLFARVNLPEAGDKLDIEKDEILRGVDDASQRSLNGTWSLGWPYLPSQVLESLT